MSMSNEAETGGGEMPFSFGKNTNDHAKAGDPFTDAFGDGTRFDGFSDDDQIELVLDGNSEFPATSHAHWSEVVGATRPAEPVEPEIDAATLTPQHPRDDREDQLATFRKLLSEVAEDPEMATEPDVEQRAPAAPETPMRKRAWDDSDERDPQDAELDAFTNAVRGANGQPAAGYSANELRHSHVKRADKLERAQARRAKSGAVLTGITLMSVVAATLVGLYVMHPKIIATSPQMAPAINEYVGTVDRFRVDGGQTFTEWKEWFLDRIDRLTREDA